MRGKHEQIYKDATNKILHFSFIIFRIEFKKTPLFKIVVKPMCFFISFSSFFSNQSEYPFKINLTASCNFGCECDMNDVQPVCGSNGLTYFSPCHAGCSQGPTSGNYSNCACKFGFFLLTHLSIILSNRSDKTTRMFQPSWNFVIVLLVQFEFSLSQIEFFFINRFTEL